MCSSSSRSPGQYRSGLSVFGPSADGRERGENQDFERKSALFSMASSEVILINIWENQVRALQIACWQNCTLAVPDFITLRPFRSVCSKEPT